MYKAHKFKSYRRNWLRYVGGQDLESSYYKDLKKNCLKNYATPFVPKDTDELQDYLDAAKKKSNAIVWYPYDSENDQYTPKWLDDEGKGCFRMRINTNAVENIIFISIFQRFIPQSSGINWKINRRLEIIQK